MIGVCYYVGDDSEDDEDAVDWFEKAAERGHDGAQYMLGYCYMNGTGVDQDDEMAQYWLHQAAQRATTMPRNCCLNFSLKSSRRMTSGTSRSMMTRKRRKKSKVCGKHGSFLGVCNSKKSPLLETIPHGVGKCHRR